jgi:hypothetical protein
MKQRVIKIPFRLKIKSSKDIKITNTPNSSRIVDGIIPLKINNL